MPPRKAASKGIIETAIELATSPSAYDPKEFEVRTTRGNRTYVGFYNIDSGTLYVSDSDGNTVTTLSPSGWTELINR